MLHLVCDLRGRLLDDPGIHVNIVARPLHDVFIAIDDMFARIMASSDLIVASSSSVDVGGGGGGGVMTPHLADILATLLHELDIEVVDVRCWEK